MSIGQLHRFVSCFQQKLHTVGGQINDFFTVLIVVVYLDSRPLVIANNSCFWLRVRHTMPDIEANSASRPKCYRSCLPCAEKITNGWMLSSTMGLIESKHV